MSAELNQAEAKLVECYRSLETVLREHGHQLAPFAHRNSIKALAALWQIMNGLDQDPGQIYDLGA
ncbi:MAG TPA: hypothetical protein VFH75_01130 [Actinomycetota bacterium]|nr:hypothetical protein [Actinomycetota bacterium]